MVTNKEARNVIECMITNIVGDFADREMPKGAKHTYDALEKAEEALEKQIPKKPNIVINKIKYYNCGLCGSNVRFEDEYRYLHYCGICGQAIDWSDEICTF